VKALNRIELIYQYLMTRRERYHHQAETQIIEHNQESKRRIESFIKSHQKVEKPKRPLLERSEALKRNSIPAEWKSNWYKIVSKERKGKKVGVETIKLPCNKFLPIATQKKKVVIPTLVKVKHVDRTGTVFPELVNLTRELKISDEGTATFGLSKRTQATKAQLSTVVKMARMVAKGKAQATEGFEGMDPEEEEEKEAQALMVVPAEEDEKLIRLNKQIIVRSRKSYSAYGIRQRPAALRLLTVS
jgi:hypothetical protein